MGWLYLVMPMLSRSIGLSCRCGTLRPLPSLLCWQFSRLMIRLAPGEDITLVCSSWEGQYRVPRWVKQVRWLNQPGKGRGKKRLLVPRLQVWDCRSCRSSRLVMSCLQHLEQHRLIKPSVASVRGDMLH